MSSANMLLMRRASEIFIFWQQEGVQWLVQ